MSNWYETRVDRQIREAAERGEFDNLPGSGKPLPNRGELHDDDWWLKDLVRRETLVNDGMAGALPPALALRKEVEDLPHVLARKHTEAAVRSAVGELNDRILLARRGPVDGPPVAISPVDPDEAVQAWRAARAAARTSRTGTTPAGAPAAPAGSRRHGWWRRRRSR
jgi:hypothetical protein